jgi:hypothetical protein
MACFKEYFERLIESDKTSIVAINPKTTLCFLLKMRGIRRKVFKQEVAVHSQYEI